MGWSARIRLSAALFYSTFAVAQGPDWSENAIVPAGGRDNPYGLQVHEWEAAVHRGREHALVYPVEITGVLMPYAPLKKLVGLSDGNPLKKRFLSALEIREKISTPEEFFAWLGMQPYPQPADTGVYQVPYPGGARPSYPMGVTMRKTPDGLAVTFGCAACHGGSLFGKRVLGLTNRFPRANRFFYRGKELTSGVPPWMFQFALGTTAGEKRIYEKARDNLRFVHSRLPLTLGLDTSLAHTALSLARRAPDATATKDPHYASHPDPDYLDTHPADSKPSVWWNLKYKNRWLSDGSVVSGNPVYTNFLWNEIGRGSDLEELETWLDSNEEIVRDLTAAVFASRPPRFTDFFPSDSVDLSRAKRGEGLFNHHCARCHGTYVKAWSLPEAAQFPKTRLLETVRVDYPTRTPVVDVGTDPHRYRGMQSLADRLNPLDVSKRKNILIRPQRGYVPPPLVGIWARWPYFHNNAAPSLCAVLTRAEDRPETYHAGEAENPATDFDRACNGYPLGAAVPAEWKKDPERLFDTTRVGMGNQGHDEGIFLDQGKEFFTPGDKADLIVFLQTL